jgi:hypothetical protein
MLEKIRYSVDWRAVLYAGLASGVIFWLLAALLSLQVFGSPWLFTHMAAAIPLGESALVPPFDFNAGLLITGLGVHLALSLVFAALVAFAIHRWGILVGVLGGAALGLALYAINTYSLSFFFPWFYAFRNWTFALGHIVYGALAGGVYELFEDESYDERYQEAG